MDGSITSAAGLPEAAGLALALQRSEDLMVLVAEERPDGLRLTGANDAFRRTSGFAPNSLHEMALADLLASDGDATQLGALRQVAAGARPARMRLACRRAVGTPFWFDLEAVHAGDAAGGRPALVAHGRDVTAQLREVEQHRGVQELLAKVFLAVPLAIGVIDGEARILMANPPLERLFGCEAGALLGRRATEFVAPDSRVTALAARERQFADGAPTTVEIDMLRPDGAEFRAELTAVVMRGVGPQSVRMVTIREIPAALSARVQVAGKVKLVGLEAVRSELGDRWPRLADRVMSTAEHIIRKRLGPDDTFSRTEDESFVICFGSASESEASFRSAIIGREIRQRLIGDGDDPAAAHVVAVAAPITLEAGQENTLLAPGSSLAARLETRMGEVVKEARAAFDAAVREARCESEPVYGRTGQAMVGANLRFAPAILRRLHAAAGAMPAEDVMALDLDAFLLQMAQTHARAETLRGVATPVLVNVSFEAFLTRPKTDRYVEACRKLDQSLRDRLVLLLSHLPPGMAPMRVSGCIQRLRPFCRSVGFTVDGLELPPLDPAELRGRIIAIAAPALTGSLADFIATLHARRCKLLVRGIRSWEEAERLRALGVDLVSLEEPIEPAAA